MSWNLIIALIIGMVLGGVFCGVAFLIQMDKWYVGVLREDRSDPDQPYYFMEISKGRSQRLRKAKRVMLNVNREDYIK